MGTERDELRADLLDEHGYCVNCGEDTEDCECGFGEFIDAAMAAGWRKPRVVTTAEELDALPVGSVVLPVCKFTAWQKGPSESWYVCGGMLVRESAELLYFGAEWTVLHEGAQP